MNQHRINPDGLYRVKQITGDRRSGVPGLFNISRSAWLAGVKSGIYPRPIKLSERITVWKGVDLLELLKGQ